MMASVSDTDDKRAAVDNGADKTGLPRIPVWLWPDGSGNGNGR